LFDTLREDIQTIFNKDPAAKGTWEVMFFYPGLHALWFYRPAHFLWRHKMRFLARLFSHITRFFTGIEIHPGASIGRRFFVDHGAGVVIGETAEIGDDVILFQGVVLGGTTLKKGKRHPTIGNNVVIGAGAVILGPIAIGDGARVGAGSVVIKSVPPGATVVGVPGRTSEDHKKTIMNLEHGDLPDPVAGAIKFVLQEQDRLEERLKRLESINELPVLEGGDLREKEMIEVVFSHGGGI